MFSLPLPWSVYLALACFGTSGILNFIMWRGVRLYLRTDPRDINEMRAQYPELPRALMVLTVGNRICMLGVLFFSVWSITMVSLAENFDPINWLTTTFISVSLGVFALLFYKIWTQLHDSQRTTTHEGS